MTYVREDPNAITIPLIADAPAYADRPTGMTNLQWCERELARIHAKGDRQPRLVHVGRRCPCQPFAEPADLGGIEQVFYDDQHGLLSGVAGRHAFPPIQWFRT